MTRFAFGPGLRTLLDTARDLLEGRRGYVVGGSLRDLLLGRALTDLDLAVEGDSVGFARALADRLSGHFVLLDAGRGTARAVLDASPVPVLDVALLQGGIEQDLGRRDFTIDALAAPVDALAAEEGCDIIDPHGGLRDLEQRTVRLVSEQALLDDPLRLLRAVRLAVQLDCSIAPETAAAVERYAGLIHTAARERQRDELVRCFASPRAAHALRLLDGLGLLERIVPEVTAGRGVEQPKEHHWDVFEHNIETVAALDFMLAEAGPAEARAAPFRRALWEALDFLPELRDYLSAEPSEGRSRAVLIKLAGLLHDVAKPETRAPDGTGRIRFFGHAERGAETSTRIMRRLRFSRRETEFVALMVEEHLRPGQLSQEGPPSRRALFRFFRDTGDAAEGILLLSLADALAARGPSMELERWRGHVSYIAHVLARRHEEETIARPARLLTGDGIMSALGIGPGPEVGRLLDALEEAQGAGEVSTREQAIEFVRRRHEAPPALLLARASRGGRALAAAGGLR